MYAQYDPGSAPDFPSMPDSSPDSPSIPADPTSPAGDPEPQARFGVRLSSN
jgi:hypothetical protein